MLYQLSYRPKFDCDAVTTGERVFVRYTSRKIIALEQVGEMGVGSTHLDITVMVPAEGFEPSTFPS